MAAGWPALAVVLFACAAAPPLFSSAPGGVDAGAADDRAPPPPQQLQQPPAPWCLKKECKCAFTVPADDNDQQPQVSVKCTFSGDKNVVWEQDSSYNKNSSNNMGKSLVTLELNGDGRCKLTLHGRAFAAFSRLRTFNVTGFAEVTVKRQGLLIKNDVSNFALKFSQVQKLFLETNAVQPQYGMVDVLIENCQSVRLSNEVISKLRSFVFRRIGNLELSENTFKNAADRSVIEKVILENLTADKLPSHAFITTIDLLSITNCTFGVIERNAFPVNSMVNATLTNVTVDRVESEAFQLSTLITNLRIVGCHVREMEKYAVMSVVQSIHIERSEFGSIQPSAVAVANELTLSNNTFELVASRGFELHNLHTVRVDGNRFGRMEADAFYETTAVARQAWPVLRFRDNVFRQPAAAGVRFPAVRLQQTAVETDVTGNRFVGSCGCGPWRFVAVTDDAGTGGGTATGDDDAAFAKWNYCTADAAAAECANLTADTANVKFQIGDFMTAAGCDGDAAVYDRCVRDRLTGVASGTGAGAAGGFRLFDGAFTPAAERGVITTVVLLVLCGFGAVCAVSAVTWLNARGYFIKLRSLLTPNAADRGGTGGMARTISAHSLSPMSVHEYAEIQRHKVGGSGDVRGGGEACVRVIVYQDRGTQTVPEELTPEMIRTLREKLDDPDDYAEARGVIQHLYDLIRVEETCCNNGGGGGGRHWYTSGGLDDMTSTMTTKSVTVEPGRERDVKSVGTSTPSLDRLFPSKMNAIAGDPAAAPHRHRPRQPAPPDRRRPSSVVEYADPADLLYGGGTDDGTDIYCELADLRMIVDERPPPPPKPRPPPPPVPGKPTVV